MEWIFFALAAPFLWAFGSIILKFMRTNYIKSPFGYLIFVTPATLASLLLLFLQPYQNPGINNIILLVFTGVIAYFAYALYIYVLHEEEVSRATILFGTVPMFVLIIATVFLNEILGLKDYIAFFLIMSGTTLISIKSKKEIFKIKKGIWLVLLSCVIFAVHDVILKVVSDVNFTTAMITRQAGIVISSIILLIFSKKVWGKVKETAKAFTFRRTILAYSAEIIGIAGMVFLFIALKAAPVSLVTLVGGFQPLFVLVLAVIGSLFFPKILKEAIDKKTIAIKIISALLMLGGLYLIIL